MNRPGPYWLPPGDAKAAFPDPELALAEPDGLLAVGGDLSPQRLLNAYRHGIFPWYSDGQPILWWSPDPRAVFFPDSPRVPRSLRKLLRRGEFRVTADRAFAEVIHACAAPRDGHEGTWLTAEMIDAYIRLHTLGHAHSVECWRDGELVGGLYGVAIGRVFFGESMFSRISNASRVAFVHLARQLESWNYGLIDGQVHSPHLVSLGAVDMPRREFLARLDVLCSRPPATGAWREWPDSGKGGTA